MSEGLPIPRSIYLRIVAFLVRGRFGRIELDVVDGRIVQMRVVEMFRPTDQDPPISLQVDETCRVA